MTKKIQDIINKQIQAEFYSSYLYLALAARLETLGFKGVANWMEIQAKEENDHALGFFRFLIERNIEPRLLNIAEPKVNEIKSIKDAFIATLKHEQYITALIGQIYELAKAEKDHALESFIRWYIDEQVEEEANVQEILDKIKIVGNQGAALYMLDQNLASRVYTPSTPYPAATA